MDQVMNGNQLHLGDEVAAALDRRHKGARPGRRVFDERAGIGNARFVGIADGVRNAGVWNACHNVGMDSARVPLCQRRAAVITHLLDADALVGRGRIAIVNP